MFRPTARRMRRFEPSASVTERSGDADRRRLVRAVAGGALAVMVFFGGGGFLLSDVFRVREARVEGNEGIPAQNILAASGLMGAHWLTLDVDAAARQVAGLPGIEAANIRCEWQKGCLILVRVEQALARFELSGKAVWVDADGRAQKAWDNARARLAVRFDDGTALPEDGTSIAPALLAALKELLEAQPAVSQYSFSAREGLSFVNDSGARVKLGLTGIVGAMLERAKLAQLLRDQLEARNIQPKIIDVRVVEAPYYVK